MIKMNILKCHGSSNDFILVSELDQMFFYEDKQRTEFAIKLCNRSNGIGADGILFVQKSKIADARMRIFNANGSEADMCGNGLRCVARFLSDNFKKEQFLVETKFTLHKVSKVQSLFQDMPTYSVEITPISLETAMLKMRTNESIVFDQALPEIDEMLKFTAIAVPNPHLITFVYNEKDFNKQERIGSFLNEEKTIFIDGVNVSFVKELAPNKLFVKTFERGVGFTNACGTAMAASSYVYHMKHPNIIKSEITVYNPGAIVQCKVNKNSVDLIGNATFEFSVNLRLNHENNSYEMCNYEKFSSEIEQFAHFEENCRKELREFI